MRLLFVSLFLLFGSIPAFAAEGPSSEYRALLLGIEKPIEHRTPAERREMLEESLHDFDRFADKLKKDIDYWVSRLPKRGVGIQIGSVDAAGGKPLARIVVKVLGALPQSSASEQLCPEDVIRVIDGVRIDPLTIRHDDDQKDEMDAIDQILVYVDGVSGHFRSGSGDRVSVTVERKGKLVQLSPKVEVYEKFREYAEDRIASVRAYILKETTGVERFRGVAQSGSDSEVIAAIHEVGYAIGRMKDATQKGIPANFGTSRFCPNE